MSRQVARLASLVVLGTLAVLAACGGSNQTSSTTTTTTTNPAASQVSLLLKDAPPAGVALLSFEVTINSATLQPGNVSLVTTPLRLEITKLETETAFLNTAGVAPGTYTGITVTFSNPELTILNNSGAAIGSCAAGSVCELKPPLANATVTYTGTPFPITITSGTPTGLMVDLDLANTIQNSLSINPTFTLVQLAAAPGTGELKELDEVVGQVTATDAANNQFTLQVGGSSGKSLVIKVTANTKFEDFEEQGLTSGFAAIAIGQFLKVDLRLMPDGSLIATEVELAEKDADAELEGVITKVGSNQFEMVVLEESVASGADIGKLVTVNIDAGAVFSINHQNLPLPSGAAFSGAADLMVGQHVQIRITAPPSGTPLTVTANRIRLRNSRVTGQVAAISGSTLTLGNLPALFTAATPPITQLQVLTSSATHFDEVSGISGLATGNTVSVSGLLFNVSGVATLEAKKIRKR